MQKIANQYHGCEILSSYWTENGEAKQSHVVTNKSGTVGTYETLGRAIQAARRTKDAGTDAAPPVPEASEPDLDDTELADED